MIVAIRMQTGETVKMRHEMLQVQGTGAPLGAEITGADLSAEMDEAVFQQIIALLHEHEVIYFRNQRLTPEQHIAFSRRFGELEHHVRKECCRPGYPEIFVVSNIIENGRPIGTQPGFTVLCAGGAAQGRQARGRHHVRQHHGGL